MAQRMAQARVIGLLEPFLDHSAAAVRQKAAHHLVSGGALPGPVVLYPGRALLRKPLAHNAPLPLQMVATYRPPDRPASPTKLQRY